jgi:hypothetical protein
MVKAEKPARQKHLETKEHIGGFWVLEVADLARPWPGSARVWHIRVEG